MKKLLGIIVGVFVLLSLGCTASEAISTNITNTVNMTGSVNVTNNNTLLLIPPNATVIVIANNASGNVTVNWGP